MAAVGERTSAVQIGTSVMTPTFRYNPAVIAQAFATLGCLYPGRIMLGVGTGEALNEIATGFRGAGEQDWPEFKERFARLREAVRLMRAALDRGPGRLRGRVLLAPTAHPSTTVPTADPGLHRRGRPGRGPLRRPRRVTASSAPPARAWSSTPSKLLPAVAGGCGAEAGRDTDVDRPDDRDQALLRHLIRRRALENTRFWAPLALSTEQKHDIHDPIEMEQAADALPIEQIASRWIVGSDPDEVVAQIKQYVDAGLNHLVFHGPGADQRRFLDLFERDLAPRLRAIAPR